MHCGICETVWILRMNVTDAKPKTEHVCACVCVWVSAILLIRYIDSEMRIQPWRSAAKSILLENNITSDEAKKVN